MSLGCDLRETALLMSTIHAAQFLVAVVTHLTDERLENI